MSLWTAPIEIDPMALAYTCGNDRELDRRLLPFDCLASIAHAEGLCEIGIISTEELEAIRTVLVRVRSEVLAGLAYIPMEMEDGHEYLESCLVAALGETGRKIHSYRSRNDQVWTALLLFVHQQLTGIETLVEDLLAVFAEMSSKFARIPLPGFTHTRKAMPSTVGAWIGLYRSALVDSAKMIAFVRQTIHRSPLGSGAGYGFTNGPDRVKIAIRLNFSGVMDEVAYAQASRSKYSGWVVFTCSTLMQDLNRLASDLILFSLPEFGFFTLPQAMLLGSSVMPHKRNPDVLEMIRGNYSVLLAHQQRVMTLAMNLIFGYHRDLQLSKAPVMESLELTRRSLEMATRFLSGVEVDEAACKRAMSPELYSVDKTLALSRAGQSFRKAHATIAQESWFESGQKSRDVKEGEHHG